MADDLDKYLASLPDKVHDQVMDAIRAEAQRLSDAQAARLRSLEQPPEETGDLVASCVVVDGDRDLEVLVQAGGDLTTKNAYDYALGFEFGTAHQPARPFFYSTYREMHDEIAKNIEDAVTQALKDA